MWLVFPQIAGLGRSATSVQFALASRDAARAYLAHPVLGPRLRDATDLTLTHAIFCGHDDPAAAPAEIERHWERRGFLAAIEHASVPHIEGVGILRMTHRADTDNAKAWWQQVHAESREEFFLPERRRGARRASP